MNPLFISTIIGLVIAVLSLGQVSTSVSQAIFTKGVETSISREELLVQQIHQYRTNEGVYPATVEDLVARGYWRAADNNNGFGGAYTFAVDAVRGRVALSSTIADAERRVQYMASFRHTFKPVHAGGGVVTIGFVLPIKGASGIPTADSAVPISATAPDPAAHTFWYDISTGTARLMVSNGVEWLPANIGSSGLPPPSAENTVASLDQLPSSATAGDVRYVHNEANGTISTYVYYNGEWVFSGGGGVGPTTPVQIAKSLRLRSSASARLVRTAATSSELPTRWTFSTWLKRGAGINANGQQPLISAAVVNATTEEYVAFLGDQLAWGDGSSGLYVRTSAVFRDPTAWYHLVVQYDSTVADAADRLVVTVNGVAQPLTGSTIPQGRASYLAPSAGRSLAIGSYATIPGYGFDGLLAETLFIDGHSLAASSFGTRGNPQLASAQWAAAPFSGPFGRNGFRLKYDDAASVISLGADSSGNANNWNPMNVSVAAGATHDSFTDVPLAAGGNVAQGLGNYPTFNSVFQPSVASRFSNGNLSVAVGNASNGKVAISSRVIPAYGKWYAEFTLTSVNSAGQFAGIYKTLGFYEPQANWYVGSDSNSYGLGRVTATLSGLVKYASAVGTQVNVTTPAAGAVLGIAFDVDAGTLSATVNGVSVGVFFTGIPKTEYYWAVSGADSAWSANFGQAPFAFAPPAGYSALHTGLTSAEVPFNSGIFTGNTSTEGPVVWTGGPPEVLFINGQPVTFGVHADRLAGGFKVRDNTTLYNGAVTNYFHVGYAADPNESGFKYQLAK